jgi:hypothetical protein
MSHIHWVVRQNKLEIPRDKAEVTREADASHTLGGDIKYT